MTTTPDEYSELADVDVQVQPVSGTELVHLDMAGLTVILSHAQAARLRRALQRAARDGRAPRGAGAATRGARRSDLR